MSDDEYVDISKEFTSDENERLMKLYEDTLEEKGLSPEEYDFDNFIRDIVDFYIKNH